MPSTNFLEISEKFATSELDLANSFQFMRATSEGRAGREPS
jgi:hypothetical protein